MRVAEVRPALKDYVVACEDDNPLKMPLFDCYFDDVKVYEFWLFTVFEM